MPVEAPLPEDHPMRIAFQHFKDKIEEGVNVFDNCKKWAHFPEHVDGSLWRAFMEGYEAGRRA